MSSEILKQVDDILLMARTGTPVVEIREKHIVFARERPTLFNMIVENPHAFDRRKLIQMMFMKNQVGAGELTPYQAATRWGKRMADEYLPDNLGGQTLD